LEEYKVYRVQDVMNTEVVTIAARATIEEAIRCLVQNHISGLPVLDEKERLVGIISEFQLLEAVYSPSVRNLLVCDLMTKDVLTIAQDALLSDAASLMVVQRIRRIPVVDDGKVVGVVARRDLLRCTLEGGEMMEEFSDEIEPCASE
jgi:CBS domain-containing protein